MGNYGLMVIEFQFGVMKTMVMVVHIINVINVTELYTY